MASRSLLKQFQVLFSVQTILCIGFSFYETLTLKVSNISNERPVYICLQQKLYLILFLNESARSFKDFPMISETR